MKHLLIITALLAPWSVQASFDWDPFYESLTATNGATFQAWRPFYSTSVADERWRKDYVWPVYTKKGFKDEQYSRFLIMGWSTDFSPETERDRTWIIPIYFQGTSAEGDNYLAIFPIGGTIHEFMGRDRLWFVLFPLFARSRINEVQTTSVLWPIGSKTSGDGIDRFRVWPIYGRSALEDEYEKKFVLWPIYSSVKYTNARNPGGGFILVPIYGRIATEKAVNQWFIPPLFRFASGDRQRIVHAPWPFFQWWDGDIYRRVFWPVYGKKQVGALTRRYWLWPFLWAKEVEYARYDFHRRSLVPFFTYESRIITKPTKQFEAGDVAARYWRLWPLMSWARDGNQARFRLLELWPLRNTAGIERNWSPFWTFYSRERSAEAVSHNVLWGLYRQSKGDASLEWSLLKGFAGYKRSGNNRGFSLLFIRFGNVEEQP
jgi:hypothetical protein